MANSKYSVVTWVRRVNLAKITSGAVESIPKITHIAFGDGGLGEDGQPLQPDGMQTELNHEIGRYEIDSVVNPPLDGEGVAPEMPDTDMARELAGGVPGRLETTNRYTVTIPEGDLNGKSISEMALVDAAGMLAAVKNFLPKGKDEDVQFTFQFDDVF